MTGYVFRFIIGAIVGGFIVKLLENTVMGG